VATRRHASGNFHRDGLSHSFIARFACAALTGDHARALARLNSSTAAETRQALVETEEMALALTWSLE
jgi:hypothetical protein